MIRYIKHILLFITAAIFVVLLYGLTSFNFRYSDDKIIKKFRRDNIAVAVKYIKVGHRKIRYVKTKNEHQDKLAIFVHGGPGSCSEYFHYLKNPELLEHYQMITLDRPGYGYSDLGLSETNILEQGRLLLEVVEREGIDQEVMVIGHSYGAPIVAAMSMQDSCYIDNIVLVSGAMDPSNEKRFWFSNLTTTPFVYNFVSSSIRAAIDEKESHAESLEALRDKWKKIKIPTIVIHGNKDKMVPVKNVDFLKSVMHNENVEYRVMDNVNHIIQFSHSHLIVDALLHLK